MDKKMVGYIFCSGSNTFLFPGFTQILSPELTEDILKDLFFEREEGKVNDISYMHATEKCREINLAY